MMNVLTLGGRVVGVELARDLVRSYLDAVFDGVDRHARRVDKITAIEREFGRK